MKVAFQPGMAGIPRGLGRPIVGTANHPVKRAFVHPCTQAPALPFQALGLSHIPVLKSGLRRNTEMKVAFQPGMAGIPRGLGRPIVGTANHPDGSGLLPDGSGLLPDGSGLPPEGTKKPQRTQRAQRLIICIAINLT